MRDAINLPATATEAEIEAAALTCDKVKATLADKAVKKLNLPKRKIVNIVAG